MPNICTEFSNVMYPPDAKVYFHLQYLVILVMYGKNFYTNDVIEICQLAKAKRSDVLNNDEQNSSSKCTGSRKYYFVCVIWNLVYRDAAISFVFIFAYSGISKRLLKTTFN